MFDIAQLKHGNHVQIDRSRDDNLSIPAKSTLADQFLGPDESYQDLFARVAAYFSDNSRHAQRIYDYMSRLWFMPSPSILANAGPYHGLPLTEQAKQEKYLSISDQNIETFLKHIKTGDGILIPDAFMQAVEKDEEWTLKPQNADQIASKTNARDLWGAILTKRIETGGPNIVFIDTVNTALPEQHKMAGLRISSSNHSTGTAMPSGEDPLGGVREAVYPTATLNLDAYTEWNDKTHFIEDIMRFLDNVLTDTIDKTAGYKDDIAYTCTRARPIGLGVMGFHSFLQSKMIAMEDIMAKVWNARIFEDIKNKVDTANKILAKERGACTDASDYGIDERFSYKTSILPTDTASHICGDLSNGIAPYESNTYIHKGAHASFPIRNPHLEKLLLGKNKNTEDIWLSIASNEGSVSHLNFLTDDEKNIFKISFEIDPRWLLEHCTDRAPFICQSQTLDMFLTDDMDLDDISDLHINAWKKGIKSLRACHVKQIDSKTSFEIESIKSDECQACRF